MNRRPPPTPEDDDAAAGFVMSYPLLDLRVETVADELIATGGSLTPKQVNALSVRLNCDVKEIRALIAQAWDALTTTEYNSFNHKRQAQVLRITRTIQKCTDMAFQTEDPRWLAEAAKHEMILAKILWSDNPQEVVAGMERDDNRVIEGQVVTGGKAGILASLTDDQVMALYRGGSNG